MDNQLAFVEVEHPSDIVIWDTNTSQIIKRLQGHTKRIYQFIWGSGGIISTSFDGTTRIWNPRTGESVIIAQTGIFLALNWNSSGTLFLAMDDVYGIHVYDAVTGDIVASLATAPTANSK
jgi:WD40 repeat protein